jgi:hypothetical protein
MNLIGMTAQTKENLSRLTHQRCMGRIEYLNAKYRQLRHGTLRSILFEPDCSIVQL